MTGLLTSQLNGDDLIELEPPRATLEQAQLALSNRLELVSVEHDVWHVARRLKSIDAGLSMFFDKTQGIFVLFWEGIREKDGRLDLCEDFVGAYTELDQRLISLIERIDREGRGRTNLETELRKLEAQKDAENDWELAQQVGDAADRMRHSIRRDLALEGSSVQMTMSRGAQKMRKEVRRREKRGRKANR